MEGHWGDPACGAAEAGGDVQERTLEDNRFEQDQGGWTLEVAWTLEGVLVQVRILVEGGTLVEDDRPGQVLALLLGDEEGVDHGVGAAAAMGQGVVDFGEGVRMLDRGHEAQQAPVDHQVQEDCWAWDRVRQVEVGSSRRPS